MGKESRGVYRAFWSFLCALPWAECGWPVLPPFDEQGLGVVDDERVGPPVGHPERLVPDLLPTPTEAELWAQLSGKRRGTVFSRRTRERR
jgi:hypothetical protein